MIRLNAKRLAAVLPLAAIALTLPAGAQQPAWKRIADKLRPDSEAAEPAPEGEGVEAAAPAEGAEAGAESGEPAESDAGNLAEVPMEGGAPAPGAAPSADAGAFGLATEKEMNLGSELAEWDAPRDNAPFSNPEFIAALGENPRFVYDAFELPDPMVFPPLQREVIRTELLKLAGEALAASGFAEWEKKKEAPVDVAKIEEAIALHTKIFDLGENRYSDEARTQIAYLQAAIAEIEGLRIPTGGGDPPAVPAEPVLPDEIVEYTVGIIAHPTDPMVLNGDVLLRKGDVLPHYTNVTVDDVIAGTVFYRVSTPDGRSKTFPVEVKAYEDVEL